MKSVRWYLRGVSNRAHSNVGKSLGSSDMSDPVRLHEGMKTSEGVIDLWDCDGMSPAQVKQLYVDLIKAGQAVQRFASVDEGMPELAPDDDEIKAELGLPSKPGDAAARAPLKLAKKSLALKAAQKRLRELKGKRRGRFNGVH